jgi:hypothetical protein
MWNRVSFQVWIMWIEKLADGVLELDTPIGPRYVRPNFAQRAYLIWVFRNFFSLSPQVLQPWERRLIDRLWSDSNFVSLSVGGEMERPIIGKIERRLATQAEGVPVRKPASASNSTATEPSREAASA